MFKCPICTGKTKVVQTRHEDDKEIIRKCKCLECGQLFYTKEEFYKYTEQTIRNAGQKVTTRYRGSNIKPVGYTGEEFFRPGESLREAYARATGQTDKVRLVGSRSPEKDAMIKMVTETPPMSPQDWMKFYDEYAKNVDTSDVGVIPPEV